MTKKTIYQVIGLIALAVIAVLIMTFMPARTPAPVAEQPTPIVAEGTLEGTTVCLPHKNTEGPQTLECAFGLQTASSTYYALDTREVQTEDNLLQQTGIKVKVSGTIVPVEALSSNNWQNYNIKGIIAVKTYERVATTPAPVLVDSKVTLGLNEPITVNNTEIKPWAVLEDNRCPSDVQCIQAGRVVVGVNVNSPSGPSSFQMTPGQTATTETLAITLDKVTPNTLSTHKIADNEYRFTLTIKNK